PGRVLLSKKGAGVPRVVLAREGAFAHLGGRLAKGLSHLVGREPGEPAGPLAQDRRHAPQRPRALREGRPPPRPERLAGARQPGADLARGVLPVRADTAPRRWVDRFEGHGLCAGPERGLSSGRARAAAAAAASPPP